MKTGLEIVELAKGQLMALTGQKTDTVSSMRKEADQWRVTVIMLEMTYVPDTRDLLAAYDVLLDENGDLISYERIRRYRRDESLVENA
jgi:hypothetical protein